MTDALTSPPSISLRHPRLDLQVRFDWEKDRYRHTVLRPAQELQSVIGDDASWPATPPLQQLSVETIDEREVALGVGSAGTSHWSVSVEPTEAGFLFDWACRTSETPGFLGSSYRENSAFQLRAETGSKPSVAAKLLQIVPEFT
ncbi:MAG: hypothetical protein AAFU85_32160, partial [Planctomycetota bacterium]